jgi:hypothetical protein
LSVVAVVELSHWWRYMANKVPGPGSLFLLGSWVSNSKVAARPPTAGSN